MDVYTESWYCVFRNLNNKREGVEKRSLVSKAAARGDDLTLKPFPREQSLSRP